MQLCTTVTALLLQEKLIHFIKYRPPCTKVWSLLHLYYRHYRARAPSRRWLQRTADQYSPKSRNCFMESGEGENLEKCSICLGALARAAFFMINLTNFMIAPVFYGSRRPNLTAAPHVSCQAGEGRSDKRSPLQPMGRRDLATRLTQQPMRGEVGGTSVFGCSRGGSPSRLARPHIYYVTFI